MTINKNWVIARLSERSTWLGIAGFLGVLGYHLNPTAISQVAEAAIAIASAALVVTGDK